jgi:hypothetical protein
MWMGAGYPVDAWQKAFEAFEKKEGVKLILLHE